MMFDEPGNKLPADGVFNALAFDDSNGVAGICVAFWAGDGPAHVGLDR
jgi:hypothetical protein